MNFSYNCIAESDQDEVEIEVETRKSVIRPDKKAKEPYRTINRNSDDSEEASFGVPVRRIFFQLVECLPG